jgi:hypothetical protein
MAYSYSILIPQFAITTHFFYRSETRATKTGKQAPSRIPISFFYIANRLQFPLSAEKTSARRGVDAFSVSYIFVCSVRQSYCLV